MLAPSTREDNIREVKMAMENRETFNLIGSDKVEGTNVYGPTGKRSATSSAS